MEIILNDKLTLFIFLLLNLLSYIQSQLDDLAAIKALSCVSIVTQKYKKGQDEISSYSPYVLTCFIKITEEQAQRVLSSLEEGINPLDSEELEELTDVNSLRDIPQDEIKEKSELLENTIKVFQKLDDEFDNLKEGNNPEDEDFNDDDYDDEFGNDINNNNKISKKGIFGLFKKGINGIFNVASSIWYAIFILIIIYFILMLARKTSDESENKNINNELDNKKTEKEINNDKKDNKNKDENEKDKTKTD